MKDLQYLLRIKNDMEKQSEIKNFGDNTEIRMDWGELKFILSFVSKIEQFKTMNSDNDNFSTQGEAPNTIKSERETNICYLCGKDTVLIRPEQHVMLNNDCFNVKCLDCLLTQLQNSRQVTEQLVAYTKFVSENNLDEAFEYFWQECLTKGEIS